VKNRQVLKVFNKTIKEIMPSIYLWLFIGAIASTLNTLLTIMIPKLLIDAVMEKVTISHLLKMLLVIGVSKYVLLEVNKWIMVKQNYQKGILNQRTMKRFAKKITAIDYSYLEDPDMLDLKERATFAVQSYGALEVIVNSMIKFLTAVFTLIGISGIIIQFNYLFLLIIFALSTLSLVFSYRIVIETQKSVQQVIPINRKYNYYVGQCLNGCQQNDFRIYNMSDMMVDKITDLNMESMGWSDKLYIKLANILSIQSLINHLTQFVTFAYGAICVLSTQFGHKITLGEFTLLVGASQQFSTTFMSAVESYFKFIESLNYLEPFAQFMALPESEENHGEIVPESFETLEFHNVSFSYPKSEKKILNRISFSIHKGEKISIVGLNNAGKSTIVKLICRFYRPNEGEILYNGRNIEEYDYGEYMKILAVVFQDYKLFPFTIKENIVAGRTDVSDEEIWQVLEETNIKNAICELPKGLDTYLDKHIHEDGTDFSGGQRQKLAIARSVIKQGELVILDEPTAALDPLAESEIYEDFHRLVRGRTAIFISHRMSSSVFCDKILLLQDGEIKAFDSHTNLMKQNNLYSELFTTQAKNYQLQTI
jgi:ATP-binding cassette, subfamily B, bacterial